MIIYSVLFSYPLGSSWPLKHPAEENSFIQMFISDKAVHTWIKHWSTHNSFFFSGL